MKESPQTLSLIVALVSVACHDAPSSGHTTASSTGEPPLTSGPENESPSSTATGPSADSTGSSTSDAEGTTSSPPPDDDLPSARFTCAPTGDACDALPPMTEAAATVRPDVYLDEDVYPEDTEPPLHGGRVQIAAMSSVSGTVTGVLINGVDPEQIYSPTPEQTPPFEWYHVWPQHVVEGEPVWVAFHSRDPAWDAPGPIDLVVQTDAGPAVSTTVTVEPSPVRLTYVTATADSDSLLLHLRNDDVVSHTLDQLWVDGRDVWSTDVACVPSPTLAPGETALWTVPRCTPWEPGEAWTVVAHFEDVPPTVGVGRIVPPTFPIETWPSFEECPFIGGDEANMQTLLDAAIDTIYFGLGICGQCGCDEPQLIEQGLTDPAGTRAIVNHSFVDPTFGFPPIEDTSGIVGVLTGDESDDAIYGPAGIPIPAEKAAQSRQSWSRYPELPTFNGGKTNKYIGTFAGMSDVQGMDLYIAACAPHITAFGAHPPVRGAYDYLRNARNNHMPSPTWLYSQGLSPVWNASNPISGTVHVQPSPAEIWVQALSVLAAGGKGLLWFQTDLAEAALAPESWEAISEASRLTANIRDMLREGDPTGLASSPDEVLVEAIRGPSGLVVPVISLRTLAAPDDVSCLLLLSEEAVPHWEFEDVEVRVEVEIPSDLGIGDVFEMGPDGPIEAPSFVVEDRAVVFPAVPLSAARPGRVFVLESRIP